MLRHVVMYVAIAIAFISISLSYASDKSLKDEQASICRTNLQQLDEAKQKWASTTKAVPGDTSFAIHIVDYLPEGNMPKCPSGGVYQFNVVGKKPSCSIHGAQSAEIAYEKAPQGIDSMELENALQMMRKMEQAKELGEIALRMAPRAFLEYSAMPMSGQMQERGFGIEQPPTLKADMIAFRVQLKAGANPDLIRIKDYTPPERTAYTVSFGSPGKVVAAEEGGMTLFEYLKAIKQYEALKSLKEHGSN